MAERKISGGILLLVCLFVFACASGAALPLKVKIQGRLAEKGAALDGLKNVEYAFAVINYDLKWMKTAVNFENGAFSTDLTVSDGTVFVKGCNLLLKIEGQPQPFLLTFNSSSPYAFYAADAEKLGGVPAGSYIIKDAQGNLVGVKMADYVKKDGDEMAGVLGVGTLASGKINGATAVEGYSDSRGIFGMGNLEYALRGNSAAQAGELKGAVVGENSGEGFGAYGFSQFGTGIAGYSGTPCTSDPGKTGVYGSGGFYGVQGMGWTAGGSFESADGTGVYGAGKEYGGDFVCTYGDLALWGKAKGNVSYGVWGEGATMGGKFVTINGAGTSGISVNGTGAYGQSEAGTGAQGETSSLDNAAVRAENLKNGIALQVDGHVIGSGTTEPKSAADAIVLGSGKYNYDVIVNDDLNVKKDLWVEGGVEIKGDVIAGSAAGNLDGLMFRTYEILALNGMWGGQSATINAPALKGKTICFFDVKERFDPNLTVGENVYGDPIIDTTNLLITGKITSIGKVSCNSSKGVLTVSYPGSKNNQYSFHEITVTVGYKDKQS